MYPDVLLSAIIICNSIFALTLNMHVCVSCVTAVFLYLQGVLTNTVLNDGLAEVDRLTLGNVKVWGVKEHITVVTMSVPEKPDTNLAFTYNMEVRCFMQTYTSAILSESLIQLGGQEVLLKKNLFNLYSVYSFKNKNFNISQRLKM